jgi:hypothetical protein
MYAVQLDCSHKRREVGGEKELKNEYREYYKL